MFCHIVFSDFGTNKAHCPCLNPVLKMDQVVPPTSFVSRPGQMAMSACLPHCWSSFLLCIKEGAQCFKHSRQALVTELCPVQDSTSITSAHFLS